MVEEASKLKDSLSSHGYELQEQIGRGGFATVYKVRHVAYDRVFALKVLHGERASEGIKRTFQNEIQLLKKSPHQNVIQIYNYFEDDEQNMYIALEYCPNGSLMDLIKKTKGLEDSQFLSIAKQILSAITYMHSINVSHGDIKPDNILFDEYNRPKLGDFGLGHFRTSTAGLDNVYDCSPAYAPPEVLRRKPYDPYKADIWSFGVTCYQMIEGMLPFKFFSFVDIINKVSNRDNWVTNNKYLQRIVDVTLDIDPKTRISAEKLLEKPFFVRQSLPIIKIHRIDSRNLNIMHIMGKANVYKPNKNHLTLHHLFPSTSGSLPKVEHMRLKARSVDPARFSSLSPLES